MPTVCKVIKATESGQDLRISLAIGSVFVSNVLESVYTSIFRIWQKIPQFCFNFCLFDEHKNRGNEKCTWLKLDWTFSHSY